jgi:putative transposase
MKGKRFAAEQILRILHEAEAGGNVRDVCRQHNIAAQTLSRWRRQFGGLEVSEVKRLRALQREHAALKRLVGALPWTTAGCRLSWEKTGPPDGPAPSGSVSGADVARQ